MIRLEDYYIEGASWDIAKDQENIRKVREAVFVEEQDINADEEFDNHDAAAHHFIAYSFSGDPIGTCRLLADGKIGRVAVVESARRQGIGHALVRNAMELAVNMGMEQVSLLAQVAALDFYRPLGFEAYGDIEMDAGIEHQWMRAPLDAGQRDDNRQRRAAKSLPEEAQRSRFETLEDYCDAIAALLPYCKDVLQIFTHDLEPQVLNRPELVKLIEEFLVFAPKPEMRIVVQDPKYAIADGHRLIQLGQRLSSKLQIRVANKDHQDLPEAFMQADNRLGIYREFSARWEGELWINRPVHATRLSRKFTEIWDAAHEDPNFRRLGF